MWIKIKFVGQISSKSTFGSKIILADQQTGGQTKIHIFVSQPRMTVPILLPYINIHSVPEKCMHKWPLANQLLAVFNRATTFLVVILSSYTKFDNSLSDNADAFNDLIY